MATAGRTTDGYAAASSSTSSPVQSAFGPPSDDTNSEHCEGGLSPFVLDSGSPAFSAELRRQSKLPGIDGLCTGVADGSDRASSSSTAREKLPINGATSEADTACTMDTISIVDGEGAENRTDQLAIREWDVNHGPRKKDAMSQMQMVIPAVTRACFSLVGGAIAGTGYATGKFGEAVGAGKAVDSTVFQAGFKSFMWSNGIFPTKVAEPLGEAGSELQKRYELPELPRADNMSMTPIILSNHICYLDGPILAALFGAPKMVAKSDARNAPVFGKIMEEMETVFVDRNDKDSRQKTLAAIASHSTSWKFGDRPMLIFPEGTTTNGDGLLEFKKGAFISGVPVRPVLIVYTGRFDPEKANYVQTLATTNYVKTDDGPVQTSDSEWAAEFMGNWIHSIHVRVLPPYVPDNAEVEDADLYARNVRTEMGKALQRVKEELSQDCHDRSWKGIAGRTEGGLNYEFGDLSKTAYRKASSNWENAKSTAGSGWDTAKQAVFGGFSGVSCVRPRQK